MSQRAFACEFVCSAAILPACAALMAAHLPKSLSAKEQARLYFRMQSGPAKILPRWLSISCHWMRRCSRIASAPRSPRFGGGAVLNRVAHCAANCCHDHGIIFDSLIQAKKKPRCWRASPPVGCLLIERTGDCSSARCFCFLHSKSPNYKRTPTHSFGCSHVLPSPDQTSYDPNFHPSSKCFLAAMI